MKVRFKYEKNEPVKYVGHLDVMSMFDRVFRRCDIRIQFSQGFTQRSQIIFALPSSVGVISKCEFFEVEIPDITKQDIPSIVDKLNNNLPIGFRIIEAIETEEKASIVTRVVGADYEINIKTKEISKIQQLFNQEQIYVERVAKNGIKYDMNIKPYILEFKIEKVNDNQLKILTKLKSGSNENLKPDYVISAILKNGIVLEDYQITKANVLLSN